MPYKYYNQKTDVSLPLRQVESLFDTSDQWFQLPERLLVHWSWFESDLLNQKEYKTLFFILLSLYPSCILLVFTLVNIYYLLQLLRTVLFSSRYKRLLSQLTRSNQWPQSAWCHPLAIRPMSALSPWLQGLPEGFQPHLCWQRSLLCWRKPEQ